MFLSFRGTNYYGWQSQPGKHTVQGVIEKALTTILGQKTAVMGAGRTDTGVHAAYFCAHFDTVRPGLEGDSQFLYNINSLLPDDIAISCLKAVRSDAHARFDAISRTYRYTITGVKDPFALDTSWLLYWNLDLDLMNQAATALLSHSDFTSFSRLHGGNKTSVCRVSGALWVRDADKLVFTITADRFLRNMVRAIVGTMIPVGRGKISISDFEEIIDGRSRSLAGQSAPASGLSLVMIKYPEDLFT